mgnify:CR=1 FL=1
MAAPYRQFCMYHTESSYGTPGLTAGAPTADNFGYLRLNQDEGVTGEMVPTFVPIPYGGGYTTEDDTVVGEFATAIKLASFLYPAQAKTLLDWCFTRINSGRTTPWTTTDAAGVMPPNDLASLSLYRAVMDPAGTFTRERYAGCKAQRVRLALGNLGEARVLTLEVDGFAQRILPNAYDSSVAPTSTEIPDPGDDDLPRGPFTFGHVATGTGTVSVGGVERKATLTGLTITAEKTLEARRYASPIPEAYNTFGRRVTVEGTMALNAASYTDRAAWLAATDTAVSIVLDTGAVAIEFELNSRNRFDNWQRQTPNGDNYTVAFTLVNRYDGTAGEDMSVSVTEA